MSGEVLELKVKDEVTARSVMERRAYVARELNLAIEDTRLKKIPAKKKFYLANAVMEYLPKDYALPQKKEEIKATDALKKQKEKALYKPAMTGQATVYAEPQLPVPEDFAAKAQRYNPGKSPFAREGQSSVFSIELQLN
ncbi:MAG TPA: hypothetical protein VLJ21_02670 [Candidatus Binatia bacterium]|nr:hypothetical protein [Candidatus Binatia bacterium]